MVKARKKVNKKPNNGVATGIMNDDVDNDGVDGLTPVDLEEGRRPSTVSAGRHARRQSLKNSHGGHGGAVVSGPASATSRRSSSSSSSSSSMSEVNVAMSLSAYEEELRRKLGVIGTGYSQTFEAVSASTSAKKREIRILMMGKSGDTGYRTVSRGELFRLIRKTVRPHLRAAKRLGSVASNGSSRRVRPGQRAGAGPVDGGGSGEPAPHDSISKLVWVDIANPSDEEVAEIGQAMGLHEVTVEDLTVPCREKVEVFPTYTFVVVHEMHHKPGSSALETAQMNLLVYSDITFSFHRDDTFHLPAVMYRLQFLEKNCVPSTNWIAYAVFDEVVNMFMVFVEQMVAETTSLDGLVLELDRKEQGELLLRIAVARRRLATIRSSLWVKQENVDAMLKRTSDMTESVQVYLRDVRDHVISMLEKLSVAAEVLNHLDQTYLSRISLQTAEASENMNIIMKKFSAVATIFLPLSVLVGIWGMNVQVPGQNDLESNYTSFIIIVAFMVFASVTTCVYFRKQGWF